MNEKEFLQYIVENIVVNKDNIIIDRTEDSLGILLSLKVHSDDMALVIWKSWNTINSIRTILRLFWSKVNKKINLKVLD